MADFRTAELLCLLCQIFSNKKIIRDLHIVKSWCALDWFCYFKYSRIITAEEHLHVWTQSHWCSLFQFGKQIG